MPIYAAGRAHPLKEHCAQVLLLVAEHPRAFVTDAEVLQELLHRYLALRLWPQGRVVFQRFGDLMEQRGEAVRARDVEHAAGLANVSQELGDRDLLHAAVLYLLGVSRIISSDRGFHRLPEVERLDPAQLTNWQHSMPE